MTRQKYLFLGNVIFGTFALIFWLITIFNEEVSIIYPISFNIVQTTFLLAQVVESKYFNK